MNVFNKAVVSLMAPSVKRSTGTSSGWPLFPFSSAATAEGKKINAESALKISAFWCGINSISNAVAILPKSIYQENNGTRTRAKAHPVDYLIHDEPNSYMTSFVFWSTMTVSMLIRGNAYALIVRNNSGYPMELRFLHPDDVTCVEHEGALYYKHKKTTYLASEIFHIPGFSYNGITGRSVLQYSADNLGMSLAADEFASNAYSDRGTIYGVAESDAKINDIGAKNINTIFNNAMSNGQKYKVAVFDEGLKYKSLTLSPNESEFIKAKASGVEDIARWLNIPLYKLHAPGEGGYNFLVQMSIEFLQSAIMPIGQKIKEEADRKLLSGRERRMGFYTHLNYKKLLEVDPKARAQYFKDMVYMGAMNVNEVRALEDYNPREGGDSYYQMSNLLNEQQVKNSEQE